MLGAGTLDELVKGCAALAVAQFRQSPYWIAYLTQWLRVRCGVEDRGRRFRITPREDGDRLMPTRCSFATVVPGMTRSGSGSVSVR